MKLRDHTQTVLRTYPADTSSQERLTLRHLALLCEALERLLSSQRVTLQQDEQAKEEVLLLLESTPGSEYTR